MEASIGSSCGSMADTLVRLLALKSGMVRHFDTMTTQHNGMRTASVILAAWFLSLGFDFLLHGGLLAKLYAHPTPFLLDPVTAFRRIPIGYLSFLVLTAALQWFFRQSGVRGAISGLRYGTGIGFVIWGALTMGLYSISTATLPLLVAWWIGQSVELGLAGLVIGAAENGVRMGRLWSAVLATVVMCLALTIFLQSFGYAPASMVIS